MHTQLNKKTVLKFGLFLAIFAILFSCINFVLSRKDPISKMADFYSEQHDFDVLFFGSSHPQYAIQPMELWQKYGFTSYNLAVPSERLPSTYYSIQLALQETHPKLIVVDVFTVDRIDKNTGARENPHYTLDLYPFSLLKVKAIKNILNDNSHLLENEIEYLFNFPLYHNRWEELTAEDFYVTPNFLKGAETSLTVAASPNNLPNYAEISAQTDISKLNLSVIKNIIDLCRDKKINLALTYLPHIANKNQIMSAKAVQKFAKENHVEYINYLEAPVTNPSTDFKDYKNSNSHLNLTGAKKLATHLGEYLKSHYNLPDHREDPNYASWHTDYSEYQDYLKRLSAEEIN